MPADAGCRALSKRPASCACAVHGPRAEGVAVVAVTSATVASAVALALIVPTSRPRGLAVGGLRRQEWPSRLPRHALPHEVLLSVIGKVFPAR